MSSQQPPYDYFRIPPERSLPSGHLAVRRHHLLAEIERDSRRSPVRRRRGLYALIATAAAAAAVVATPALGVIRDLFEGSPPTPAVQRHFVQSNNATQGIAAAPPPGLKLPFADTGQVHGVIAIATDAGPLNLWAAPVGNDGRECWLLQFANDHNEDDTVYGPSGCDIRTPVANEITWSDYPAAAHPGIRILVGQAFGNVATVNVAMSNGALVKLPVIEHFFLAAATSDATPTTITSYNAKGITVGQSTHGNVVDSSAFQQGLTHCQATSTNRQSRTR
jgi:hypothetical protein